MKLKILICAILLISTVFPLHGCASSNEIEFEGVVYRRITHDGKIIGYKVMELSEDGKKMSEIYIYDEIKGAPVQNIGDNTPISGYRAIFLGNYERIYFPWSIKSRATTTTWSESVNYIFSPSTDCIVDNTTFRTFVIPKLAYDDAVETNYLGEVLYNGTDHLIPANVSFFFNYVDNPNDGYFFIDLLEESGKLTKPPYDPKRDGYKFVGWYKEVECINEWDFDTDTVTIEYDEYGERIYEEIKLYAKWEQNN